MGEAAARLRADGWGFEGVRFPPPPALCRWLGRRLGTTEPFPPAPPAGAELPPPRALPDLPLAVSTEPRDRLLHARGRGFPDLIRLRWGRLAAAPDGVVRPADAGAVEAVLAACAAADVRLVPWGGGTSVTGGVNPPRGPQPVVVLDLERLSGLRDLDPGSRLATFGAGTRGPALEAALAPHGLTLGHFPQSWELSTLGGWIVTRSAGQESLGAGRIEDLVAGLEAVAPAGRLSLPALPASSAGPDLRQLVMGSEGRLGVVTEATVRVRPRPSGTAVEALLLPSWEEGVATVRELVLERAAAVAGAPLRRRGDRGGDGGRAWAGAPGAPGAGLAALARRGAGAALLLLGRGARRGGGAAARPRSRPPPRRGASGRGRGAAGSRALPPPVPARRPARPGDRHRDGGDGGAVVPARDPLPGRRRRAGRGAGAGERCRCSATSPTPIPTAPRSTSPSSSPARPIRTAPSAAGRPRNGSPRRRSSPPAAPSAITTGSAPGTPPGTAARRGRAGRGRGRRRPHARSVRGPQPAGAPRPDRPAGGSERCCRPTGAATPSPRSTRPSTWSSSGAASPAAGSLLDAAQRGLACCWSSAATSPPAPRRAPRS